MDAIADPHLALNGIEVDLAEEVLRGPDGRPIPLRPQAFALLRYLAANPGRVLTKDELMAAVWNGTAVTDDSLVQCVGDIRRAIGDDAHTVVRTVPRRGYRLDLPPTAPVAAHRSRAPLALAAALAVAAVALTGWLTLQPRAVTASIDGPPIVAVVPFVDVAGDPASQALLGGFGKHFYTQDLARFREFQMVMRGPTFVYRDQPAGGLAIDYLLGGAVRREGDRLHMAVQVTDALSGDVLWSERWDRSISDIPAMRAEVTAQIANRIGSASGVVQELGRAVAAGKRPSDRTAWEHFLLGSGALALGTRAGAAEAADLLGRSVALDPDFAHAAALLALARLSLAEFGIEPEPNLDAALEAARQAAFLDPEDAWAHVAFGTGYRMQGDHLRARSAFETALAITPNVIEILAAFAGWAPTAGEPDRGAAIADRAMLLEPDVQPRAAAQFARAYFMAGRYRSALAMIDRVPADGRPPSLQAIHAGALAAVGRPEDAAAVAAAIVDAVPGTSIETLASAPRWGDAERRRLVVTLRLTGFPACAGPDATPFLRLPECIRRGGRP